VTLYGFRGHTPDALPVKSLMSVIMAAIAVSVWPGGGAYGPASINPPEKPSAYVQLWTAVT